MKTKLFAAVFVLVGLIGSPVNAKSSNERPPRWVIEKYNEGYRCPKIEDDLRKMGLPVKPFSYLAWRESRCRVAVIGWNYRRGMNHLNCKKTDSVEEYRRCDAVDSYDSGLMQINSSWVTVTSNVCGSKWGDLSVLRKKKCNLKVAKTLFENGGYAHWSL